MDRRRDDETLQEIYKFMGEMRASSIHRGDILDRLEEEFDTIKRDLSDTNKKVDGLVAKITRWETKLGAFIFFASCVWTFFVAMKDDILAFIKG